MATPLVDHYNSIVRKTSKRRIPFTEFEKKGRVQAIARRLLIDAHEAEYDRLYSRVEKELESNGWTIDGVN